MTAPELDPDAPAAPIAESVAFLRERITRAPSVALVLGSGLGQVTDSLQDAIRIPYEEIPGFPRATVAGHRGALVAGIWDGVEVVAMQGRFHLYEGWSPAQVAFPLRVLAALGASAAVLTNAAGATRSVMRPGQLMLITDHLNFMFRNPLVGQPFPGETRFPDLSEAYDPIFRGYAQEAAASLGISLAEGIYAAVLGPSYETPAEVRMLAQLGADAVGMSTVPEVIVARALGLRVIGISTITNYGAGLGGALSHEEVLEVGRRASGDLARLLTALLPMIAAANLPTEAAS